MTFYAGLLWLGVTVLFVFGMCVGYAARGDDNRRYHASRQRYTDSPALPAAQPVHATAQRITPQPAPQHITNVFVAQPGMPLPVDLDAIQHRPMVLDATRHELRG